MNGDFFSHIEKPTTQVNSMDTGADTFSLSAADFDQSAFTPPVEPYRGTGQYPGAPGMPPPTEPEEEKVKVDSKFTSDIIIGLLDGIQEPVFHFANEMRKRKRYFGSKEKYGEAVELSYMTEEKIREKYPDVADEKLALLARLHKFNDRMDEITKSLPLTDDEKEEIRLPLKKLVEKHNFDIPPGIALFMVACKLAGNRFIDLYAD
jgi:hypothetical protein